MSNKIIHYENYIFFLSDLYKTDETLKIEVKNNQNGNIYHSTINQTELTIQPIKKFYSVLIRALNLEPNCKIEIDPIESDSKLKINLNFNYDDLFDLSETIILVNKKITDNVLHLKIRELENRILELEAKIQLPNLYDLIDFKEAIKYSNIQILEHVKLRGEIFDGLEYKYLLSNLKPNSIEILQWLKNNNYPFEYLDFQIISSLSGINNKNCNQQLIINVLIWLDNNFPKLFNDLDANKISSILSYTGSFGCFHKKNRLNIYQWIHNRVNLSNNKYGFSYLLYTHETILQTEDKYEIAFWIKNTFGPIDLKVGKQHENNEFIIWLSQNGFNITFSK